VRYSGEMNTGRIRPLAICVFRHNGRILAAEFVDPSKGNQLFYRPLGGGIEFGEYAAQTLVRELREELKAEIANLRYLGALENIFTFDGRPGHEIVLVYDGEFVDRSLYEREFIDGSEGEMNDLPFHAVWRPLEHYRTGDPPLYPDGLYDLLKSQP
jgi:8-oxo-dGTP pyrophosphatase MutT (NUDIX family)